ncbi:MAG: hypothetical protein HN712_23265 [Gemmatimonadetes bacterium]|jgi:plastocyanin|nr:hypothetical protein [Gemmatimonadota bacterium]MBT6147581.1 hypothetical protein [Gemmatimonadota bacterium]MBT7863255.1 hypothetical protein [Gemmatimonadota bacterium]
MCRRPIPNLILNLSMVVACWLSPPPTAGQGAEVAAKAVVEGHVTLQEGRERQRPPRYYRGPYRSTRDTVTADSPLLHVVVFLENVPPPSGGWAATPTQEMAQRHDTFIPHVLPILAGTAVEFPNRDDYYHNVFSVVSGDRFDLGRYGEGVAELQTFVHPAVVVVRCEIHAGMKAYIVVRDNPYFTTVGEDGRYQLQIPAGTHRLVGWHPTRGRVERLIQVRAGDSLQVDLSL